MKVFRNCLRDQDSRVRALALKDLCEISREILVKFKDEIEGLLSDPDMKVKHEAIKILKKIRTDPGI